MKEMEKRRYEELCQNVMANGCRALEYLRRSEVEQLQFTAEMSVEGEHEAKHDVAEMVAAACKIDLHDRDVVQAIREREREDAQIEALNALGE